MKNRAPGLTFAPPILLLSTVMLQGCQIGRLMDSDGNAMTNTEVVAIADCSGEGCAASETQVLVDSEMKTGYSAETNEDGYYMYDPYAYHVPAEEAMMVYPSADAADGAVDFIFAKEGYQTVTLHHVPEYEEHEDPNTGKKYQIARAPDVFMCRVDEPDSDNDSICDNAEKQYGTSYLNADTDNDGIDDNVELFDMGTDPGSLDICVFAYCQADVLGCMADAECSAWMECMEGCGDDDMLCPTQCGAFYQSDYIDSISTCALDNGCAYVEFPDLPECSLPTDEYAPVGNIDGFWWVSAINGQDYVLYDDCQRFIFTETSETQIDVANSTLVTANNSTETRVAYNNGQFTRMPEGYLELVYDNWAGYREQYHPYYVTDNVMVNHVCSIGTDDNCHEYGTLVLTRVPLAELGAEDTAALEAALVSTFQAPLADYTRIETDNCPNGI